MQFFYILSAILLVTFYEGMCTVDGNPPEFIHYVPKEKTYSMDIQEVHECIACHTDEKPRKDFLTCLRVLSNENKQLAKQCCEQIYDAAFCNNAYSGKIDFDRICHDPSKAIQSIEKEDLGVKTNRCFWKTTDTTADDVVAFKQCRKKIIDGFCTTRTED